MWKEINNGPTEPWTEDERQGQVFREFPRTLRSQACAQLLTYAMVSHRVPETDAS